MEFIFIIAAFNAFFFSAFLLQKKPRQLHDLLLVGWLICLGLYIGVYSRYSHELFTHFHLLSISLLSLFLLPGPFLYLYLEALVTGKRKMVPNDLIHLVPLLLFNLYILFASFSPDLSEKLNIEKIGASDNPPLLFLFFLILTAVSGPVYFLLTIRLFKKLDIRIFNNFSNTADVDLFWIRKLVLVFGIVWTALIVITVIHHVFKLFPMVFCTNGLFLSLSFFVILIGYFGLKQKIIYGTEAATVATEATAPQAKYAGSRLSDTEAEQMAERLSRHMETAQPYLDADLTLTQLADGIGISGHLLSQVINEQFKQNFFDFVNHFRVEAFKRNLADPKTKNFSLLGIAYDCGFNSKSTFNRIFKKETGLTPSQYKERNS